MKKLKIIAVTVFIASLIYTTVKLFQYDMDVSKVFVPLCSLCFSVLVFFYTIWGKKDTNNEVSMSAGKNITNTKIHGNGPVKMDAGEDITDTTINSPNNNKK
jgi:hypothetical protein